MTAKKKQTRRAYSEQTKDQAVAALNAGTPGAKLEKRFGVAVAQIYVWRKAGYGKGSPQKTISSAVKATDVLLALNLDESIRLIVRDELTKLAELRDKVARGK